MTDAERARLAEVRRLQKIAYGGPTRADRMVRIKGLLALLVIVCLLAYAYVWHRTSRSPETARQTASEITYLAFNVLFGPQSPLDEAEKLEEFRNYRTARVRWRGTVAYVNLGTGDDLYVKVRHDARLPSSEVLLRIPEERRDQATALQAGQVVSYGGRIAEYDRGAGFIALDDGIIYRTR
jgi:hypothetical protein